MSRTWGGVRTETPGSAVFIIVAVVNTHPSKLSLVCTEFPLPDEAQALTANPGAQCDLHVQGVWDWGVQGDPGAQGRTRCPGPLDALCTVACQLAEASVSGPGSREKAQSPHFKVIKSGLRCPACKCFQIPAVPGKLLGPMPGRRQVLPRVPRFLAQVIPESESVFQSTAERWASLPPCLDPVRAGAGSTEVGRGDVREPRRVSAVAHDVRTVRTAGSLACVSRAPGLWAELVRACAPWRGGGLVHSLRVSFCAQGGPLWLRTILGLEPNPARTPGAQDTRWSPPCLRVGAVTWLLLSVFCDRQVRSAPLLLPFAGEKRRHEKPAHGHVAVGGGRQAWRQRGRSWPCPSPV